MAQFQALDTQELIHLSAARVWELLTDWVAAPRWMPGVDSMEAEQLTGPGVVLDYRSGAHERQLAITELSDGKSITLSSGGGDVSVRYRYDLSEDSGQTLVRLRVVIDASELLADEVGELRAAVALAEAETLRALRAYAESAP